MVKWADLSLNDGYRYTAPVGSFPMGKSPYGALDMAGNVWEIVSDWADWSYYKRSPKENPSGPTKSPEKQMPIIRGGSWYSSSLEIRTTHRAMPDPNKSSGVVGFRCAVSSPK
jgi:formylglycine-generating enzyme required for sulfatase activity